jgi:hypothetical protein
VSSASRAAVAISTRDSDRPRASATAGSGESRKEAKPWGPIRSFSSDTAASLGVGGRLQGYILIRSGGQVLICCVKRVVIGKFAPDAISRKAFFILKSPSHHISVFGKSEE